MCKPDENEKHLLAVNLCGVFSPQKKLFTVLFFPLRPVACKRKGKLTMNRLPSGGIRVVCVYLLITARLVLCGEGCLTDNAGFSSLNEVGVSNRTCVDQEMPPQS